MTSLGRKNMPAGRYVLTVVVVLAVVVAAAVVADPSRPAVAGMLGRYFAAASDVAVAAAMGKYWLLWQLACD